MNKYEIKFSCDNQEYVDHVRVSCFDSSKRNVYNCNAKIDKVAIEKLEKEYVYKYQYKFFVDDRVYYQSAFDIEVYINDVKLDSKDFVYESSTNSIVINYKINIGLDSTILIKYHKEICYCNVSTDAIVESAMTYPIYKDSYSLGKHSLLL